MTLFSPDCRPTSIQRTKSSLIEEAIAKSASPFMEDFRHRSRERFECLRQRDCAVLGWFLCYQGQFPALFLASWKPGGTLVSHSVVDYIRNCVVMRYSEHNCVYTNLQVPLWWYYVYPHNVQHT